MTDTAPCSQPKILVPAGITSQTAASAYISAATGMIPVPSNLIAYSEHSVLRCIERRMRYEVVGASAHTLNTQNIIVVTFDGLTEAIMVQAAWNAMSAGRTVPNFTILIPDAVENEARYDVDQPDGLGRLVSAMYVAHNTSWNIHMAENPRRTKALDYNIIANELHIANEVAVAEFDELILNARAAKIGAFAAAANPLLPVAIRFRVIRATAEEYLKQHAFATTSVSALAVHVGTQFPLNTLFAKYHIRLVQVFNLLCDIVPILHLSLYATRTLRMHINNVVLPEFSYQNLRASVEGDRLHIRLSDTSSPVGTVRTDSITALIDLVTSSAGPQGGEVFRTDITPIIAAPGGICYCISVMQPGERRTAADSYVANSLAALFETAASVAFGTVGGLVGGAFAATLLKPQPTIYTVSAAQSEYCAVLVTRNAGSVNPITEVIPATTEDACLVTKPPNGVLSAFKKNILDPKAVNPHDARDVESAIASVLSSHEAMFQFFQQSRKRSRMSVGYDDTMRVYLPALALAHFLMTMRGERVVSAGVYIKRVARSLGLRAFAFGRVVVNQMQLVVPQIELHVNFATALSQHPVAGRLIDFNIHTRSVEEGIFNCTVRGLFPTELVSVKATDGSQVRMVTFDGRYFEHVGLECDYPEDFRLFGNRDGTVTGPSGRMMVNAQNNCFSMVLNRPFCTHDNAARCPVECTAPVANVAQALRTFVNTAYTTRPNLIGNRRMPANVAIVHFGYMDMLGKPVVPLILTPAERLKYSYEWWVICYFAPNVTGMGAPAHMSLVNCMWKPETFHGIVCPPPSTTSHFANVFQPLKKMLGTMLASVINDLGVRLPCEELNAQKNDRIVVSPVIHDNYGKNYYAFFAAMGVFSMYAHRELRMRMPYHSAKPVMKFEMAIVGHAGAFWMYSNQVVNLLRENVSVLTLYEMPRYQADGAQLTAFYNAAVGGDFVCTNAGIYTGQRHETIYSDAEVALVYNAFLYRVKVADNSTYNMRGKLIWAENIPQSRMELSMILCNDEGRVTSDEIHSLVATRARQFIPRERMRYDFTLWNIHHGTLVFHFFANPYTAPGFVFLHMVPFNAAGNGAQPFARCAGCAKIATLRHANHIVGHYEHTIKQEKHCWPQIATAPAQTVSVQVREERCLHCVLEIPKNHVCSGIGRLDIMKMQEQPVYQPCVPRGAFQTFDAIGLDGTFSRDYRYERNLTCEVRSKWSEQTGLFCVPCSYADSPTGSVPGAVPHPFDVYGVPTVLRVALEHIKRKASPADNAPVFGATHPSQLIFARYFFFADWDEPLSYQSRITEDGTTYNQNAVLRSVRVAFNMLKYRAALVEIVKRDGGSNFGVQAHTIPKFRVATAQSDMQPMYVNTPIGWYWQPMAGAPYSPAHTSTDVGASASSFARALPYVPYMDFRGSYKGQNDVACVACSSLNRQLHERNKCPTCNELNTDFKTSAYQRNLNVLLSSFPVASFNRNIKRASVMMPDFLFSVAPLDSVPSELVPELGDHESTSSEAADDGDDDAEDDATSVDDGADGESVEEDATIEAGVDDAEVQAPVDIDIGVPLGHLVDVDQPDDAAGTDGGGQADASMPVPDNTGQVAGTVVPPVAAGGVIGGAPAAAAAQPAANVAPAAASVIIPDDGIPFTAAAAKRIASNLRVDAAPFQPTASVAPPAPTIAAPPVPPAQPHQALSLISPARLKRLSFLGKDGFCPFDKFLEQYQGRVIPGHTRGHYEIPADALTACVERAIKEARTLSAADKDQGIFTENILAAIKLSIANALTNLHRGPIEMLIVGGNGGSGKTSMILANSDPGTFVPINVTGQFEAREEEFVALLYGLYFTTIAAGGHMLMSSPSRKLRDDLYQKALRARIQNPNLPAPSLRHFLTYESAIVALLHQLNLPPAERTVKVFVRDEAFVTSTALRLLTARICSILAIPYIELTTPVQITPQAQGKIECVMVNASTLVGRTAKGVMGGLIGANWRSIKDLSFATYHNQLRKVLRYSRQYGELLSMLSAANGRAYRDTAYLRDYSGTVIRIVPNVAVQTPPVGEIKKFEQVTRRRIAVLELAAKDVAWNTQYKTLTYVACSTCQFKGQNISFDFAGIRVDCMSGEVAQGATLVPSADHAIVFDFDRSSDNVVYDFDGTKLVGFPAISSIMQRVHDAAGVIFVVDTDHKSVGTIKQWVNRPQPTQGFRSLRMEATIVNTGGARIQVSTHEDASGRSRESSAAATMHPGTCTPLNPRYAEVEIFTPVQDTLQAPPVINCNFCDDGMVPVFNALAVEYPACVPETPYDTAAHIVDLNHLAHEQKRITSEIGDSDIIRVNQYQKPDKVVTVRKFMGPQIGLIHKPTGPGTLLTAIKRYGDISNTVQFRMAKKLRQPRSDFGAEHARLNRRVRRALDFLARKVDGRATTEMDSTLGMLKSYASTAFKKAYGKQLDAKGDTTLQVLDELGDIGEVALGAVLDGCYSVADFHNFQRKGFTTSITKNQIKIAVDGFFEKKAGELVGDYTKRLEDYYNCFRQYSIARANKAQQPVSDMPMLFNALSTYYTFVVSATICRALGNFVIMVGAFNQRAEDVHVRIRDLLRRNLHTFEGDVTGMDKSHSWYSVSFFTRLCVICGVADEILRVFVEIAFDQTLEEILMDKFHSRKWKTYDKNGVYRAIVDSQLESGKFLTFLFNSIVVLLYYIDGISDGQLRHLVLMLVGGDDGGIISNVRLRFETCAFAEVKVEYQGRGILCIHTIIYTAEVCGPVPHKLLAKVLSTNFPHERRQCIAKIEEMCQSLRDISRTHFTNDDKMNLICAAAALRCGAFTAQFELQCAHYYIAASRCSAAEIFKQTRAIEMFIQGF